MMFQKFSNFNNIWKQCDEYFSNATLQIQEFYQANPNEQITSQNIKFKNSVKIYTTIYNLCTNKQQLRTEKVYSAYQDILKRYIGNRLKTYCAEKYNILEFIVRLWEGYILLMQHCKNHFCYLDRYYLNDSNLPSLELKAYIIFQQSVFTEHHFNFLLLQYLKSLEARRNDRQIGNDILFKMTKIIKLISDQIKIGLFAQLYIIYESETTKYYKQKFEELKLKSCEQYLQQILQLRQFEFKFVDSTIILLPQQKQKLYSLFALQFVKGYKKILTESEVGLHYMLKARKIQILKLIYKIYKEFDNFDQIKKEYYTFVASKGFQLFTIIKQNLATMIPKISQFYLQYLNFTNDAFENSPEFLIQFRNAMETVINLNEEEFNISENLSEALDKLFSRTDSYKEDEITNILTVFDCLSSKDIFMQSYEIQLSYRLLMATYNKIEKEKAFIETLKIKCGNEFTKIVQGKMFDYLSSNSDTKDFKNSNPLPFQFTIKILGKDYWITNSTKIQAQYTPKEIQFPEELLKVKNSFEQFYTNKHKKRHLEYLPLLSTVTLAIKLNRKINKYQKCYIKMSLFQASMLLYIERKKNEFVTFEQIATKFLADETTLRSFLYSMSSQKTDQILIKQNQSFKFNDEFVTQYNQFSYQVSKPEKRIRKQSLDIERDIAIQGAIVKIMKNKKKLQLCILFELVRQQLKLFKPSITKIKSSIQKLISREYLERSEQMQIIIYKV